jgi:hypothetical protein
MKTLDSKEFVRAIVVTTFIVALAVAVGAHPAWSQIRPYGGLRSPEVGGIAGWVLAKQAMFYRSLSGMIRLAKSDGTAIWGLMGISFLYGIFHAAGPGHGKALISSYLVANEETWRRGITLSFASAVMQSLTAVAIVGVAAVMLGATAKLMSETVRIIEIKLRADYSAGRPAAVGQGSGFCFRLPRLQDEHQIRAAPTRTSPLRRE